MTTLSRGVQLGPQVNAMLTLTSAKGLLKRNSMARRLNAAMKNGALHRRSRLIAAHYAKRLRQNPVDDSSEAIQRALAERMRCGNVRSLHGLCRPPHVFVFGTDYEQERAGFLQGISKWGRVTTLRTGEGRYGFLPGIGTYDRQTVSENSRQLVQQVEAAHRDRGVDVLLGTMVAQYVDIGALQHVRSLGIPVVNIAMDDRLVDHWGVYDGVRLGAIGLIPGVDLVLQTTPEYVPRYLVEGCPAVYWPFGSDPDLFTPAREKTYDVCFVGNNYGWRAELLASIARGGVRVECFGRGFPNGHIGGDRVPEVLARSKIVLGVGTIAHSRRIVTLKLRDFDGPMSGALYLTTYNPDLRGIYDLGQEIVTYTSPADCIRQLKYFLAHEEEREAIARAGRTRAARDHTWHRRIGDMLRLLGLRSAPHANQSA
jgi:spore maturation protein CgeB